MTEVDFLPIFAIPLALRITPLILNLQIIADRPIPKVFLLNIVNKQQLSLFLSFLQWTERRLGHKLLNYIIIIAFLIIILLAVFDQRSSIIFILLL